jgi:hypothetical protein
MTAIGHIYALPDGTYRVVSGVPAHALAQILLGLAAGVVQTLGKGPDVSFAENGDMTLRGGEIGPGETVHGVDGSAPQT